MYILDHPYRILIIGGSGSGKTNALLNLRNNQPDIDKIYLYAKDPYEAKWQFLMNKRKSTGLKHSNDLKANQKKRIEQTKFTYSLLGQAFEKQIKTIEDQGKIKLRL